jgi:hypothetical protein
MEKLCVQWYPSIFVRKEKPNTMNREWHGGYQTSFFAQNFKFKCTPNGRVLIVFSLDCLQTIKIEKR